MTAIQAANSETGGSVLELGEAEYMVRASGYLRTLDDFRAIPLKTAAGGVPVRLGDVATIQIGPEMRRGVAELNGQGEVAGGVVILRSGKNARETIAAVKAKLEDLKRSLPAGVEIVPTYDRSQLIDRSIGNLREKLIEEFIVVALVCALFLGHVRSALVAILTLPLGVLAAFLVMRAQGVNANIMSLSGIAIAIGAMVDAAVVMIENAHKKIERWGARPCRRVPGGPDPMGRDHRGRRRGGTGAVPQPDHHYPQLRAGVLPPGTGRPAVRAARLHQELRDAGAAILSVTLVPVLMGWLIRGRIPAESRNPINRVLAAVYKPVLDWVMLRPRTTPGHRRTRFRHHGLAAGSPGRRVHAADR
ncbi:MAG: efflux RND transporter permease subunit [Caulobacteraceae bacterium]